MNKIIDNITFEVKNHPRHWEIRYVTLLFRGNIVANVTCHIGVISTKKLYVMPSINLELAEYLSLSKDDIKEIIKKFILDGGLGIEIFHVAHI